MFTKEDTKIVKGIAVIMLIFHHLFLVDDDISYLAGQPFSFSAIDLPVIAVCFRLCVYMFCFLSAYGTSIGLKDSKSYLQYLIYRSWRLLSPYWFTLVVLNIIHAVIYRSFFYPNPLLFLGDLIPVLDIIGLPYSMFCPVLWYMNFTLIMIVVLPLIFKLIERFGVIVIGVTLLILNFIPAGIDSPFGGPYTLYLLAVEFGVLFRTRDLFGKIRKIYEDRSFVLKVSGFIGLILSAFISTYIAEVYIPYSYLGVKSFLNTIGAVSLILLGYLYLKSGIVSKVMEFIGNYSYDMFLIHIMVRDGLAVIPFISGNRISLYIANVICSLLAAFALDLLKRYAGWYKAIDKVSKKIKALRFERAN